jgi:hypothetical protein
LALVGKQGDGKPVFALATDNCDHDFQALTARGVMFDGEPQRMPYGTGVTFNDLYGNKIYLNEDPVEEVRSNVSNAGLEQGQGPMGSRCSAVT